MEIPAVSVIIPLYNAEKYIGECLDSILAQTFQNFEVIVVDDCSTDSSVAIVESYRERFGGRLTLSHTKKNSGGGGYVPRNIGLGLSRGEYIFFVDADDFISKTALEELHTAAKNFDADVVYIGSRYLYEGVDKVKFIRDREGSKLFKKGLKDEPVLTINDPNKNLQKLLIVGGLFHTPWTKFVQRKFLIENEIFFPKIFSSGDFVWTIQVMYFANRLLRISTPNYFYRDDAVNSITRKKESLDAQISKCVSAFLMGVKALNELSNRIDLFKNPTYFHAAVIAFLDNCLKRTFQERMQLRTQDVYEILRRELDADPTIAFMFSVIDAQQKNLIKTQQQFRQFAAQAQRRIAELEAELKRR